MIHEFNWEMNDFDKLGKGTLIGHLLECAGQVCGGYFADLRRKAVPNLWDIGFPLIEVDEMGEGFVSKVNGTGGIINTTTCTEQLLYKIYDPSSYLTPDCVANFLNVEFEAIANDKVKFSKASGKPPTDTYKVSVGYRNGYYGEGQISYGGIDCLERFELASEIIKKRLKIFDFLDLRVDFIGMNSISPVGIEVVYVPDVRLRVSGRTATLEQAQQIGRELETLYTNGPAGGGSATQNTDEVISVVSVLIPKSEIKTKVIYTNT